MSPTDEPLPDLPPDLDVQIFVGGVGYTFDVAERFTHPDIPTGVRKVMIARLETVLDILKYR